MENEFENKNKKNSMFWYFFGLIAVVIIILVPSFEIKYCFIEHSTNNSQETEYRYFSGIEDKRFYLDEGESLNIEYNSTVENGELMMYVKSPTGKIIAEIEGGISGTKKIVADTKGRYRLIIEGEKTKGGYCLNWEHVK